MNETKICKTCSVEQDISKFYYSSNNKDRRLNICGKCIYQRNKGKNFPTSTKEYMQNATIKSVYGITMREYNHIFAIQKGCCFICGIHQTQVKKTFSIDHCHETGKVRGLLCHQCNTGLGFFKDDINNLKKAIKYLKRNKDYRELVKYRDEDIISNNLPFEILDNLN